MHVRVFVAKDMTTGLKMVKEALGPEALILSTRTVRTGRLGVLGGQGGGGGRGLVHAGSVRAGRIG